MDSTSNPTSPISRDCAIQKMMSEPQPYPYNSEKAWVKKLKNLDQRGRIELIMGPMFAGKSTELLRRVQRLEISGKKCLSVKFSFDTRYSEDCISTHDK